MLEKDFSKNYITPWLKKNGVYYFKPRGGPYTTRKGIADYILCMQGRFIALEVKTETGRQTPNQTVEQDFVEKAGGLYILVRPNNWSDAKEKLGKFLVKPGKIIL